LQLNETLSRVGFSNRSQAEHDQSRIGQTTEGKKRLLTLNSLLVVPQTNVKRPAAAVSSG